MFSLIRELTPPGVVEHCVKAKFSRWDQAQLLVCRSRMLEVYDVDEKEGTLELTAQYSLFGIVESIKVVEQTQLGALSKDLYGGTSDEGKEKQKEGLEGLEKKEKEKKPFYEVLDVIILTFGTGKASIVGYNPNLGPHELQTYALYNFEPDALGSNLRAETTGQHALYGYGARATCEVDTLARCATILIGGFQVAVMPFDDLFDTIRKAHLDVDDERKADTQEGQGKEENKEEEEEEEEEEKETKGGSKKKKKKSYSKDAAADNQDEEKVTTEEERKLRLAKAVKRVAMKTDDVWEMQAGCYMINLAKVGIPCSSMVHSTFLYKQQGLPVLAILHSGIIQTSTGRICVSRWTNHLTAITISKQDVTVVWKVRRLPHDSFALVPMKNGDVLVLAQNSIHHVVGGHVRRSIEVNGFARLTAPIDPVVDSKASIEISLDGARWVWLDKFRLLLSLRFGQVALLDVGPTSMRLTLQGLSNHATCLCVLSENTLFLGSRLADSLLMSYKLFLDDAGQGTELSGSAALNEEERMLYGTLETSASSTSLLGASSPIASFSYGLNIMKEWRKSKALVLKSLDALPCTGPIGGITIGENEADQMEIVRAKVEALELKKQGKYSAAAKSVKLAEARLKSRRKPKEIIGTGGRGRDGGVRIFSPALRFDTRDLLNDIALQTSAQSIWSLSLESEKSKESKESSALVFTTLWGSGTFTAFETSGSGEDASIVRLEDVAHEAVEASKSPTINMHSHGKYIIQACQDKVTVLDAENDFASVCVSEMNVRGAYFYQSYVLVIMKGTRIPKLLRLNEDGKLVEMQDFFPEGTTALTGHLFQDNELESVKCAIIRGGMNEASSGGALEIYSISLSSLVFRSDSAIVMGNQVIHHRDPSVSLEPNKGILASLKVTSLCIAPVGRIDPDPHCNAHQVPAKLCVCLAIANGDFLLYRVSGNWNALHKVRHDIVTRVDRNVLNRSRNRGGNEGTSNQQGQQENGDSDSRMARYESSSMESEMDDLETSNRNNGMKKRSRSQAFQEEERSSSTSSSSSSSSSSQHQHQGEGNANGVDVNQQATLKVGGGRQHQRSVPHIIQFDYFAGFQGMLLVSGLGTCVCIIGSRGFVTPVRLDFDAYHVWNMSMLKGRLFVLATSKTGSRASALDTNARLMVFDGLKLMSYLRLDAGGSMPFIQLPLQASVTKLEFHKPSRSYVLLCAEDDPVEDIDLAVKANCSVRLLCADTLQIVQQYSLMRHEKAINIVPVEIDLSPPNSPERRLTKFLAVGTGFVGPEGEDAGCKGRVLVFQVTTSRDENDVVQKKLELRMKIESKHIRGPVSAIGSVDGLLLATFGSTPCSMRVFYFDPTKDAFIPRSFVDTPFSSVCMKTVKNYVLIGDLYKSVQFIQWHEFQREFRVLAKDPHPMEVYSCEFMQYERALAFVVTDNDGNLHILKFAPDSDTLQYQADVHLASPVNHLCQLRIAPDKSLCVYGTLDGALGSIAPISEQVYRRLFALQAAMSSSPLVARNAGLNPRAYRTAQFHVPLQRQRKRNIADGLLIWQYLALDYVAQRQLARLIGTTPETIHQDLLDIDTSIFQVAL